MKKTAKDTGTGQAAGAQAASNTQNTASNEPERNELSGHSEVHINAHNEAQINGVAPWPAPPDQWPTEPYYDRELLAEGDRRNVPDQYRYWGVEAIRQALDERLDTDPVAPDGTLGPRLEIAIENLGHDFNIGSIVRTANGLGVRHVHVVGRRRWNRRGAMVTDRYLHVHHHAEVASLVAHAQEKQLTVVGFDNTEGAAPLEAITLPARCLLVFGEESAGISPQMNEALEQLVEISQYGSTRSLNVGAAAAIGMWAWRRAYPVSDCLASHEMN